MVYPLPRRTPDWCFYKLSRNCLSENFIKPWKQSIKMVEKRLRSLRQIQNKKSKYHEKDISIIKQMVSASLSGVSASHMVADPHGCWNVAKRIFLWYQNIFLFNQYKFLYSGQKKVVLFPKIGWVIFFASIKYIYIIWYLYFYSIKVNLYFKRNNFLISYNLFFIQLNYFFIIWIFHCDHIWSSIFIL